MYCPHCGAESTPGLRYCKRCGANFAAQPGETTPGIIRNINAAIWPIALATVAITLGGLGIVISSAYDLVRPLFPGEVPRIGDPTPIAMTMIIFGALTILGVIALLFKLFTRMAGVSQPTNQPAPPPKSIASAPPSVQLPAPPSAMPSVTEHTTRNFESVESILQRRDPKEKLTR